MTIINCKSRTDARNIAKEQNGKVIDNGAGSDNRWQVMVEDKIEIIRKVLSCNFANRVKRSVKRSMLMRSPKGRQVEVVVKRSLKSLQVA